MFEGTTDDTVAGPGTVVGANVKLTGTISDVNDITVHGSVEGEVASDKTVIIAETATVKGPVSAQMVSISGRVNGSVTAHQKLELLPTAKINGGITTKELIIKSGASFNGKCSMSPENGLDTAKTETEEKTDKKKIKEDSSAIKDSKIQQPKDKEKTDQQPVTAPAGPTFELED
ncbi:polymer-forming cytoskeletal protein [Candidatus Berkelbacteria bacterium]|nr:polymer-forming cytoskeletal protein [Candidatus Berkelbacteria bacterium]